MDEVETAVSEAVVAKLRGTLGAYEAGVLITLFLFGITTVQAYTFLRSVRKSHSKGEPLFLKTLVVIVWIFEAVHSGVVSYGLYWVTVLHFGVADAVQRLLHQIWLASVFSAVNIACIQIFFAYRVYIITGTWLTPAICSCLSTVSLVGQMVSAATGYHADSVFRWGERWGPVFLATLALSTAADVLIAANLCWGLWKRRQSEIRSDVHRLVDKVIAWALETCLLTCIGMSLMLIFFVTMENFAWITVWLIVSRTFSNSFLASLNGRKRLRKSMLGPQLGFVEVKTTGSLEWIGRSHLTTGNTFSNARQDIPKSPFDERIPRTMGRSFHLKRSRSADV